MNFFFFKNLKKNCIQDELTALCVKENIACLPRRFIIYCSVNVIMPFIIPVLETCTINNVEKIISVIEKKTSLLPSSGLTDQVITADIVYITGLPVFI